MERAPGAQVDHALAVFLAGGQVDDGLGFRYEGLDLGRIAKIGLDLLDAVDLDRRAVFEPGDLVAFLN